MSSDYSFYVYIMASHRKTIYVGVTRNLLRRVYQHRNGLIDGFTKRYNCRKLVYTENYNDIKQAIRREKEIKGWKRFKKVTLIEKENPQWKDLWSKYFEND